MIMEKSVMERLPQIMDDITTISNEFDIFTKEDFTILYVKNTEKIAYIKHLDEEISIDISYLLSISINV